MTDKITEGTKKILSLGCEVFQIFQLDSDEREHSRKLLEMSDLPYGAKVMDVGCGVGAIPRLWKEFRPDLEFVLVNDNSYQLSLCPDEMEKILSDAHEIPASVAPVDTILVHYTLGYLDLEKAFSKFYDLLKDGGELQIYDMLATHSTQQSRMKQLLSYNTYYPTKIVSCARKCGFDMIQQTALENTSKENFEKVLALETEEVSNLCKLVLFRTSPVFWRFKKGSQTS